jgi:hypothetical protein
MTGLAMVGPPRGSIATIMKSSFPPHPCSVTRALHRSFGLLANHRVLAHSPAAGNIHCLLKRNFSGFEAEKQHAH